MSVDVAGGVVAGLGGGFAAFGPFRGPVPYDEASAAVFFGRTADTEAVFRMLAREGVRSVSLTGDPGAGKTSLIRAGLIPLMAKHGVLGLYIGSYDAIDHEIWQSASRVGANPPSSSESPAEYIVRLARGSAAGTVLVLDHLEGILDPGDKAAAQKVEKLGALLGAASGAAGSRLRFLLCVDKQAFHRLDQLHPASALSPVPGTWMELGRLGEDQITEILEQTALQTGTFFEAGLAQSVAADMCRNGPCLPIDLQIVARTLVDLRLTSLRRYERSGESDLLRHVFFERLVSEGGGRVARRVLLDVVESGPSAAEEICARTGIPRPRADTALASFVARGVLHKREREKGDSYALIHPALAERITDFLAADRAATNKVRRSLRKRVLAGQRLPLRELVAVYRHLGQGLGRDSEGAVARSVRRLAFQGALVAIIAVALLVAIFIDLRTSYTLAYEPSGNPKKPPVDARVVVRLGRPSLSFMNFLPSRPRLGSVIADTGFSAAGIASDLSSRIVSARASGALERDRHTPLPQWMRTVVNGLRPVQRGVTLVLLGDPNGVISLKQAFADAASRRETLEALAVIGAGRAGEDEILASALADPLPEVRRRGVEVAASIDRRMGNGSHGTTLRNALGDRSFEVKSAVLQECDTLVPDEAASILAVALGDKDAAFRRLAEQEVLKLAKRSPAAAAQAVHPAVRSTDASTRENGLVLLERVAARAPAETASVLTEIATDEKAPEEARVAALLYLRRAGVSQAPLQPVLEKAVSPEATPRLRTAALPLYARLLDSARAEELAISEGKLGAANRAASAAIWGTIASKQPEAATKALKAFLYDPSPDARVEAARSFGYLKREGAALVQKAILDANPDVQRAAIESAVQLSATQSYAIGELLGRAFMNVRPAARRWITDALGRIGQDRPASVVAPLAKVLREGDVSSRAGATATFCTIAKKNAVAAAPYLRLASRDDAREVRTAVATCLGDLAEADPKGAARIAGELADAGESTVRSAAAVALGKLGPKARDLMLGPLLRLLADTDRPVRMAALESLCANAETRPSGKKGDEMEKALASVFAQGDADERRLVVKAAARSHLPSLLRHAANDPDENIRIEAVISADSELGTAGLEIVQAAAEDRSAMVRAEAVSRLAKTRGDGARQVLPVFEAMLRSGDPVTKRAGAMALGELSGAGPAAARLLGDVLRHRGEAVRAAAAQALGRIAERDPASAQAPLEGALLDPAYDVRSAASRSLGAIWANQKSPGEIGDILARSETDSARRFVALEALVIQAQGENPDKKKQSEAALKQIAESGQPLGRLAAQIGRAFLHADRAQMHAFLEKLLND